LGIFAILRAVGRHLSIHSESNAFAACGFASGNEKGRPAGGLMGALYLDALRFARHPGAWRALVPRMAERFWQIARPFAGLSASSAD